MKITVHIGSTKTGSSALQMHLAQSREKLKEVGILYPEIGTKSNAHHVLFASAHPGAWGMHRDVLTADVKERFEYFRSTLTNIVNEASASKASHLVLSSEYWWGLFPDKFQRLISSQFKHHELRLVACVRRQDRWLEASYLQAIKGGEKLDFGNWLDKQLVTPALGGAHYLKIINHWTETLLPYETLIIPYEFSDRTEYIRMVASKVCDSDVGSVVAPGDAMVVNKSPNAEGVAAILKMNQSKDVVEGRAQKMNEIMGSLSRPENTRKTILLSEAENKRLLSQFSKMNDVICRQYCLSDVGSLFSEDSQISLAG